MTEKVAKPKTPKQQMMDSLTDAVVLAFENDELDWLETQFHDCMKLFTDPITTETIH